MCHVSVKTISEEFFYYSNLTMQYLKHSLSIIFFSWCLTHSLVGDCGQPISVRWKFQHTEASVVYARRSALSDLPDLTGWQSSSASMSWIYSDMKPRISTASNISIGRSLNSCSKHHITTTNYKNVTNEKSAQRDANTAHCLCRRSWGPRSLVHMT